MEKQPTHSLDKPGRNDCSRKLWLELKKGEVEKTLTRLGLNFKCCNPKNKHFKIKGHKREIHLYATTGTVNAPPYGKLKACKYTDMKPSSAFDRILSLAKTGY